MGMAASLGSGLAMMGGRKGWGDSADAAHAGGAYSGLLSAQARVVALGYERHLRGVRHQRRI